MLWAWLANTVPLYPLYALLFADTGLSDQQISTLFLIWTAVAIVAEVPSGAVADRFPRRTSLVVSNVLQAAAYVLWTARPGYAAFAAGFVLWGLGGAFGTGPLEALLYDGLAARGAQAHYPRIYGRVTAAGHLSQLPVAAAATVLYAAGGYPLVGWASVGCCLAAAGVGLLFPGGRGTPGAAGTAAEGDEPEGSFLQVLRAGLAEAARHPPVRAALIAVGVLGGVDALEEYLPLVAQGWGVTTAQVPFALLVIPVAGAMGSALGGRASNVGARALACALGLAVAITAGAAWLGRPAGLGVVAVAYGLFHLVLVMSDTRLQSRIKGPARATVTSVASVGMEVTAMVVVGAWALGGPTLVGVLVVGIVIALPRLLGRPDGSVGPVAWMNRRTPR